MFLYFMSKLINGSIFKASAAPLSGSLMYSILGKYSYNIGCQRSTLSVVRFSNVRVLWSVYTVIRCLKIIVRNSFKVYTIIKSSLSVFI